MVIPFFKQLQKKSTSQKKDNISLEPKKRIDEITPTQVTKTKNILFEFKIINF